MSLSLCNEHTYIRSVNISRSHLEAPNFQNYSYVQFLKINHRRKTQKVLALVPLKH